MIIHHFNPDQNIYTRVSAYRYVNYIINEILNIDIIVMTSDSLGVIQI